MKEELSEAKTLDTKAGFGVRYVLPQKVSVEPAKNTSLFLRVASPFGKVRFTVKSGDKVLATAVRLKAVPGEMEKINIPADKLADAAEVITVSLEEL